MQNTDLSRKMRATALGLFAFTLTPLPTARATEPPKVLSPLALTPPDVTVASTAEFYRSRHMDYEDENVALRMPRDAVETLQAGVEDITADSPKGKSSSLFMTVLSPFGDTHFMPPNTYQVFSGVTSVLSYHFDRDQDSRPIRVILGDVNGRSADQMVMTFVCAVKSEISVPKQQTTILCGPVERKPILAALTL